MNFSQRLLHVRPILKSKALIAARTIALAMTTFLATLGIAAAPAAASGAAAITTTKGTLTLTPPSASFGTVGVASSHSITVNVKNTGTANVAITMETLSGAEFTVIGLTGSKTLAPGTSMTVTAKFTPTVSGSASGSFNITSNATNNLVKYALSGVGVAPALTNSWGNPSFGNVPVGTTNSQLLQLKNISSKSVTITGTTLSLAGYRVTGLPQPYTMAPGATARFNLAFTPTTAGFLTGTLTVNTTSPNVPLVIHISGTGVSTARALAVTPSSVDFGSAPVGSTHVLTVNLKNTGNSSVTVSGVSVSASDFTTSGGINGMTLAAGQSATLNVIYAPKTATKQSGTVKILSNAANSPSTVTVVGNGVSGTAHSVSLTWGASSTHGVSGYYVYRSTISGNGFTRLVGSPVLGLQYTDSTVQSGTTYYYVVTAVLPNGQESPKSTQTIAVIP